MYERFMFVGESGTGKTYTWLKLAEFFQNSTFWAMDTDDSVPRMLHTEFKHLKNVQVFPVRDWEEAMDSMKTISSSHKKGDWVVVDMVDSIWDYVQAYYVEQVFEKKISEFFLEVRKNLKEGKRLEALEGWKDWSVINTLYKDFITPICYKMEANVVLVAKVTPVLRTDSPEVRSFWSGIGIRAEGEKRNAHRVHTVLYFQKDALSNKWYVTTVKDRGRQCMDKLEVTNFPIQYGAIAGWDLRR